MEEDFKKIVWDYYTKNKRQLPWRETTNPYKVFISEVMLQQTQVTRIIPKYDLFLKTFPNFSSLANAPLSDLLRVWQGIGYNRRALYLQKSAQIIVKEHNGLIPKDTLELIKLPGIGISTASSILVYAYNLPLVFIETNVRRIYIHHFFKGKENIHDKELLPYVEQTLDRINPREWYYALMDYGTYLAKTIENPNRKSKHYTKQSKFHGSIRQVRGHILKLLVSQDEVYVKDVLTKKFDTEKIDIAIKQLIDEGFIEFKNNKIFLKS